MLREWHSSIHGALHRSCACKKKKPCDVPKPPPIFFNQKNPILFQPPPPPPTKKTPIGPKKAPVFPPVIPPTDNKITKKKYPFLPKTPHPKQKSPILTQKKNLDLAKKTVSYLKGPLLFTKKNPTPPFLTKKNPCLTKTAPAPPNRLDDPATPCTHTLIEQQTQSTKMHKRHPHRSNIEHLLLHGHRCMHTGGSLVLRALSAVVLT